jgi:WD40 repeat protein
MAMQVSLFRYPALGGRGKVYGGHSSHVTAVRFSADGQQLFSGGGGDACILHWAVMGTTKPPASSTERTPRVSQVSQGGASVVEAAPVPPANSLPQG